jgi:hypothetical protein
MLGQFIENPIRTIAGMNGNVGVYQVGHGRNERSASLAQGHVDWLPFFDSARFGHAAQRRDNVGHTIARWKYSDDVAEAADFQIDV